MAARSSLRDYQRELAERLRNAGSGRIASRLGVRVGTENWLVNLVDASEVIPVPAISPVPLARPWFKGITSIRGMLYGVVDFPAFLGGTAVAAGEQARLLLIGERFKMGSALLVDRSLGLRNPERLQPRASARGAPWLKAEYTDTDGTLWRELDMSQLVQHADFLAAGA